jgi:integrase
MPRKRTPRLSEALAEYQIVRSAHLAPTTLANDRSVLQRFVEGVGNPPCHQLSARACELYFAQEAARQQASSFNKIKTRIGGFTKFMQRRGWLDADPIAEIQSRRVTKRERLRLSAQELREAIEGASRARDRAFLAAAVHTALRASDLTAIKLGDVDLDEGRIHVITQKTQVEDWLPISTELDAELWRWLSIYAAQVAEQQEQFPDRGYTFDSDAYLFPPYWNEGYTDATRLSPHRRMSHPARIVQDALGRLGYPTKGEGVHTFRRSTARLLFEHASNQGHDSALRIAAALLGHRSTTTTEGYLGISLDRQKRDDLLRGRSFLPVTDPTGKVVPLRRTS